MSINGINSAISQTYQKNVNLNIKKQEDNANWFSDWVNDKDKICTDGQDDGKLTFVEAGKSFGKGLIGIVKGIAKHPIMTATTIAAGIGITVLTGGAAAPVMVALGAATGAGMIGVGAYKAATAKTDGEAKQAFETMGNGTFALGASALSAKTSLNQAAKAGVTGAQNAKDLSIAQATIQNFKVAPEAIKMSAVNAKGNFLTWTTGNIYAHSNKLQGAHEYMSKANEVKAYRFNPNGTAEDIIANNPGVFQDADGNFCLPNKWDPSKPYIIDTTKEQMIMQYAPDDMAVCDGGVFKGSYVDTATFKEGTLSYQDPVNLEYGKVVDVTKQAPGAFKVMPEGTKIHTLEGPRTVQAGEVVALDHEGNPYVTTIQNIAKRNTGFSQEAQTVIDNMMTE